MPWLDLHRGIEEEFESFQDNLLDDVERRLYLVAELVKVREQQNHRESYLRLRSDKQRYTKHLLLKARRVELLRSAVRAVYGERGRLDPNESDYQKKYKAQRRNSNLCVVCGAPTDDYTRCSVCHEKSLASSRQRLQVAKEALEKVMVPGFVPRPTFREIIAESAARRALKRPSKK